MDITLNAMYRIKGKSKYFMHKYGTHNPIITIEDLDTKVFGKSHREFPRNPACLLFMARTLMEELPTEGNVYYGKVNGFGELVHESELTEA